MQETRTSPLRIAVFGAVGDSALIELLRRERGRGGAASRASYEIAELSGGDASSAGLALILVDAKQGLAADVRQQARLASLFGIPQLAIAVDGMDALEWQAAAFELIARACEAFTRALGFTSVQVVPVSAQTGDNVVSRSARTPWYRGATLLEVLEAVETAEPGERAFRMSIAELTKSDDGRRGFSGRIASGRVRSGDSIRLLPSGVLTRVARIDTAVGERDAAGAGERATLTLADAVDAARGYVLTDAASPVEVADQFEARLLWMSEHDLMPGRIYAARIHGCEVEAAVTEIKYRSDASSDAHLAAKSLQSGDLATVNLSFDREVPFEPFAENRVLGAFSLFDRASGVALGAGIIEFALRRATNVHWQAIDVTPAAREAIKGQRARCFWFTGLPSSGKSTVANLFEKRLHAEGLHTYLLDGDNVRHGLNRDLGFTEVDRVENIRRVTEVARLMVDAGLVVLVSFISPFRSERTAARKLFKPGDFIEVFVDAPLAVCEQRDPKGLYAKARAGNLANFTGIDSPYEPPEQPEARIDTTQMPAERAAEELAALALRK